GFDSHPDASPPPSFAGLALRQRGRNKMLLIALRVLRNAQHVNINTNIAGQVTPRGTKGKQTTFPPPAECLAAGGKFLERLFLASPARSRNSQRLVRANSPDWQL